MVVRGPVDIDIFTGTFESQPLAFAHLYDLAMATGRELDLDGVEVICKVDPVKRLGHYFDATQVDKIIDAKFEGYSFQAHTDRTITDLPSFKTALDDVRRDGFAWNDREEYDHLVGISAPVFNYLHEPIAVLNVWTVHARHSLPEIMNWSGILKEAASNVTTLIGGAPPELATLKTG